MQLLFTTMANLKHAQYTESCSGATTAEIHIFVPLLSNYNRYLFTVFNYPVSVSIRFLFLVYKSGT